MSTPLNDCVIKIYKYIALKLHDRYIKYICTEKDKTMKTNQNNIKGQSPMLFMAWSKCWKESCLNIPFFFLDLKHGFLKLNLITPTINVGEIDCFKVALFYY